MRALPGSPPRDRHTAIVLPTLLALIVAILVGSLAIARLDEAHAQTRQNAFIYETGEISLRIEERLKAYRQVLRGTRALFAASEEVTRKEWQDYVDALRLPADYPGIQGLGFAIPVAARDLARHEQQIRAEGFPDYRISPPGPRAEYTTIVFLEPFDWRNQRAFGYDMYAEPVRREAMERARHLGTPALTGKVRLVQETSTDTQAGVLLYLPVFRPGLPLFTPVQQEKAFRGWVFSPFRMRDLITGALGESAPRIRLRIYDGHDESATALLFDSHPERPPTGALSRRSVLELDNRVWTLAFDSSPAPPPDRDARQMELAAVLLIGALFVLLTGFFFSARRRASELDRIGTSLRASEARYSTLVNLSQDGIAALDAELRFTFLNPRLNKLLGYPEGELIGGRLDSLWPTPDSLRSRALAERLRRGKTATSEQELRHADGRLITAIVTDAPHIDQAGVLQGAILTITDISERKAAERRIHYLATHDPLTGLANRAMFMEQMHTSLHIARRHRTRFALLFLDLDHFKEVNDTLGHATGDALLIEAARRMRLGLRASDLLARQGGDEFMALLHDIHSMKEALGVAEKIRRALNEAFILDGRECLVSASIGIALYPEHGADLESLTRNADAAMYRAKVNGRNGASGAPNAPEPPLEA